MIIIFLHKSEVGAKGQTATYPERAHNILKHKIRQLNNKMTQQTVIAQEMPLRSLSH